MRSSETFQRLNEATLNRFHKKVTFLSGMGVFLEGYDFTNIASALIFLVPYFHLRPGQIGLVAISTYLGTIVGAIGVGYLADRFGRKFMYLTDITLYALFALLSAFAPSFMVLVVARIGLGFAIGADQALSFTIIAEFAPTSNRGKLNASTWVMWTVGSGLTYLLSYGLSYFFHEETWRILFGLSIIPSLIVLYARSKIPESPRWLAQKGDLAGARDAIREACMGEVDELTYEVTHHSRSANKFSALFAGRKQTMGTLYIFFMWFCVTFNTYGVGYFTPFILKTLGFTAQLSLLGGAIVSLFAIAGSIVMFFSVEKIGRKPLAIAGFALLAMIDFGLAMVAGSNIFLLLLALFSLFQFVVWIGPAGLVGVVAPEVFPTSIRSFGTGVAASLGRMGAIAGILLFPLMMKWGGLQLSMAIFCLDAVIATVAMIVFGRETKGDVLD